MKTSRDLPEEEMTFKCSCDLQITYTSEDLRKTMVDNYILGKLTYRNYEFGLTCPDCSTFHLSRDLAIEAKLLNPKGLWEKFKGLFK